MAYIISQPAPQPMIIDQAPPPVIVQSAPQPTIIHTQPAVVFQSPMKSLPASTRCSVCQQQVVTVTRPINGILTWMIFGILFIFIIWPFCLIPFCVKSCKDIEHTCPSCHNVIHVHKRM